MRNGQVHIQPVETGIDNGDWIQIKSGLVPGDKVVMMGKWHVAEGQKVRAIPYKGIPFRAARQL